MINFIATNIFTQNEEENMHKNFSDKKNYYELLDGRLKDIANQRNQMDGLTLLQMFQDNSIPAVFFDPQYRGVMDKMKYGNECARQKERAILPQMSDDIIIKFIHEISRTLIPSGHLLLWIDKFHLVEGVKPWFKDTKLELVDMITWDKGKIGMGYRTRRKSEYLIIAQKIPKKAKGYWISHDIPDVWLEKVANVHPHSKPEQLQASIINAIVKPNDFVVDPASGGFSVMRSALSVGRKFIGCDLLGGQ
jgi:site-specific DNA-methyltransferase (adenine-specific)